MVYRRAAANHKRTTLADGDRAGVGVGGAVCGHRAGDRERSGVEVEGTCPIEGTCDGQRAGGDRRAAGVGVRSRERGGAGAEFVHRASAADAAVVGGIIRAVEGEGGVVGDVSGDRTAGAAIAELQGAGGNGGGAVVGIAS